MSTSKTKSHRDSAKVDENLGAAEPGATEANPKSSKAEAEPGATEAKPKSTKAEAVAAPEDEAQRLRSALRTWVGQARKQSFDYEIKDDTPIIEQRIITSIQVMDLLLFIEELIGRPIEIEQVRPSSFRDINSICNAFFEETQ